MIESLIIIGYSGHSYVVIDEAKSIGIEIKSYFDQEEKIFNPYQLRYLGTEHAEMKGYNLFFTIGNNQIRESFYNQFQMDNNLEINIISKYSTISDKCLIGTQIFIGPRAIINSLTTIGDGCILNSGCVVEHECTIGKFTHVAPGAVLCGGVSIGNKCLIGANSTILPGITIGNNSVIGAGSVVTRDIPSNSKFVGNPAKAL